MWWFVFFPACRGRGGPGASSWRRAPAWTASSGERRPRSPSLWVVGGGRKNKNERKLFLFVASFAEREVLLSAAKRKAHLKSHLKKKEKKECEQLRTLPHSCSLLCSHSFASLNRVRLSACPCLLPSLSPLRTFSQFRDPPEEPRQGCLQHPVGGTLGLEEAHHREVPERCRERRHRSVGTVHIAP